MSEISFRGGRRTRYAPAPRDPKSPPRSIPAPRPADPHEAAGIFVMPTVEEVVAAGYPASHWEQVKARRDELVRRFDTDPDFRASVLAERAR